MFVADWSRRHFRKRLLHEFWVLWNKTNGATSESVIRNVIFRREVLIHSQLKVLTLNVRLTFGIWSVRSRMAPESQKLDFELRIFDIFRFFEFSPLSVIRLPSDLVRLHSPTFCYEKHFKGGFWLSLTRRSDQL